MKRRPLPPFFAAPFAPANLPVRRCPVPREQVSQRILIMRLGAFGDILMGTPLLTALRDAFPDAHLTWIAEHREREAIDAHPCIDEVLVWDGSFWRGLVRRGLLPVWLFHALRLRRALRDRQYDVFISFQPEEWPLLTKHCGAPVRIGVFDTFQQFAGARRTSPHTRLFTTALTAADLPPHRTEQYLLPLRVLGLTENVSRQMTLGFTQQDDKAARALLTDADRPFVVLAPFTTWPSRCWPAERYAALGDILAQRHGLRVVLIGSAKEANGVRQIAAQMQTSPIIAAGVLGFREMAALIARAALLVSGDTGPMHVAAAVGTPRLSLFGPTPAEGRAPLSGPGVTLLHPVPCGPCDKKHCANPPETHELCMKLITVDEAAQAAGALLESLSSRREAQRNPSPSLPEAERVKDNLTPPESGAGGLPTPLPFAHWRAWKAGGPGVGS